MTATTWRHAFFFFNDTATTEIYTLSLHDALPISRRRRRAASAPASRRARAGTARPTPSPRPPGRRAAARACCRAARSEEHTSELQSRLHLVCRLLLEKKKNPPPHPTPISDASLDP